MMQRTNVNRRPARNQLASPYARPNNNTLQQKSSWSLSGFVNWIKAATRAKNELDEDDDEMEAEASEPETNPAAQALVERGNDMTLVTAQVPTIVPSTKTNIPQPPPSTSYTPPSPSAGPPRAQTHAPEQSASAPPAITRALTSPLEESAASSDNVQAIQAFLQGKNGQPLNRVEVAGLVSLLQNSVADDEKPEPFRFSTSPPTPRATTPTLTTSISAPTNGEQPRKMLAKNPNGPYRWQGAGSARPRNRYQSPGFGPSRSSTTRMKLSPEKATTDNKRRRIGEDAESSTAQPSARTSTIPNGMASTSGANGVSKGAPVPFSATSPSSTYQASTSNGKPNGLLAPPPTTPRIRTTGVKPTAPAVPSPLRQTWSQGDPSPPASKPTRAANVMVDLIKEATPPKKPVFTNPYEAMYPAPIKPTKKPVRKRSSTKNAAKQDAAKVAPPVPATEQKVEQKQEERQAEMSPRKIIEATVPKGAKRARPPPDLEKQKQQVPNPDAAPRRSMRLKSPEPSAPTTNGFSLFGGPSNEQATKAPVMVEEISDEEQPSPSKKPRTKSTTPTTSAAPAPPSQFAKPPVPSRSISVEEIEDEVMETESAPVVHPSQVIEPEENTRSSTSPLAPAPTLASNPFASASKGAFTVKSSAPKAPSKLRYSIQPENKDPAPEVAEKSGVQPPSFLAQIPTTAPPKSGPKNVAEVQDYVKRLPQSELPSYSFDFPTSSAGAGPSTLKAREAAKAAPVPELPTYTFTLGEASSSTSPSALSPPPAPTAKGFDWSAAGMQKPAEAADKWTCSTCALQNPASATEKCTVCDAPRPGKAAASAAKGFDWAAAGMKKPGEAGDKWTCSMCSLQNPASATEKCTICDAPRPGKPSAPATTGFNWAAAGMAKPSGSADKWTCSMCSLQNPASATDKCTVCDAPRPGKASAPATKGFDWAAAGMQKPGESADKWTCSTCALQNPASATEKCTVCDAPRPGKAPAPAAKGFDWAAAGMKLPQATAGGTWSCKTCMLQNPADATKCTVCDEPR